MSLISANSGPPSEEDIAGVKSGIFLLSAALKNNALYPEGNPIRTSSITTFQDWLANFLVTDDCLQLEVRKTTFLFKNIVVYQECPPDQHFIAPLYRDGIKILEFHKDTPFSELEYFIHLLIKFRLMKDDAEDDLVTALWEVGFTHLKHYTAESLWGGIGMQGEYNSFSLFVDNESYSPVGPDGPVKNISDLFSFPQSSASCVADHPEITVEVEVEVEVEDDEEEFTLELEPIPEVKKDLWTLSKDEHLTLSIMITTEEARNNVFDALRVIKGLFHTFISPLDHVPICNYISDVTRASTSHNDLRYIINYLKELKSLVRNYFPGLNVLMAKILNSISSKEVLIPLFQTWGDDYKLSNELITDIAALMNFLPQKSIMVLIPLLSEISNTSLRQAILPVIATKICQPGFEAATLISDLDSQLIVGIIRAIRKKQLKPPQELMENLSRHEFVEIREVAIKVLLESDPENIKKLLHLLDDQSPSIYTIIYSSLSKWATPKAEQVLLNHLHTLYHNRTYREEEYLLCCYKALGQRASVNSLTFLKHVLLKNAWKLRFNRATAYHRQGAALTLMLMPDTQETKPILATARLNFFSSIRRAVVSAQRYLENKTHGH